MYIVVYSYTSRTSPVSSNFVFVETMEQARVELNKCVSEGWICERVSTEQRENGHEFVEMWHDGNEMCRVSVYKLRLGQWTHANSFNFY